MDRFGTKTVWCKLLCAQKWTSAVSNWLHFKRLVADMNENQKDLYKKMLDDLLLCEYSTRSINIAFAIICRVVGPEIDTLKKEIDTLKKEIEYLVNDIDTLSRNF
jgi:hypothetical protein